MGEGNEGGTALAIGGGSAGLGVSCLGTVRVLVLGLFLPRGGSDPATRADQFCRKKSLNQPPDQLFP